MEEPALIELTRPPFFFSFVVAPFYSSHFFSIFFYFFIFLSYCPEVLLHVHVFIIPRIKQINTEVGAFLVGLVWLVVFLLFASFFLFCH